MKTQYFIVNEGLKEIFKNLHQLPPFEEIVKRKS